ncbi:mediator of RNA polymerase II transcription subunit 14 [Aspergillus mulundensis]|uniref:Mediator of RNA polymerase II transcription subunit 14 n=1 Tax=Aspergillus mulundensis TaxID=1810919 RepID=A0A3D8RLC1_9EURO|nr:Mediator of RNA polymerase II transcription subunit 14 [Aspergillus mulundensis]RDW74736.1 Mediator of RNA polymerase II transcription subunit 14 [Aspergillus mulundensis]
MGQNHAGEPGSDAHDQTNGITFSQSGNSVGLQNGSLRTNGVQHPDRHRNDEFTKMMLPATDDPPKLQHIVQGFFPLSKLLNRSTQQCWNDLAELVAELSEIQIPSHDFNTSPISTTGKVLGNQSPENLRKKLRVLEFAQAKRGEFIKLLVLSQWSRQAADVSRLVDIQNFIRTQHQAYGGALQCLGDMKRDLVRAQVANPDLTTALEVLSKEEVISMPDLGYRPPKPLTPKSTLRKLRKINRIISMRLSLHDKIPYAFQKYRVHDGRVTFIVPGEFELDLSIGEEDAESQFFFVDIRFLFNPSPSVPAGRIFSELDIKINDILRSGGLPECFDWLHNLTLTNKISILTRQASEMSRSIWSNGLRIELLHRTLVLQYWASKPGTKSWLEIGIRRGARKTPVGEPSSPSLGLRWMRDGQEVGSDNIEFDTDNLSVDRLLRSAIALHISYTLSSVFSRIREKLLYSNGSLSLRAHLTSVEPSECELDVQLTASRRLRVAIEPLSGVVVLAATPNTLERIDTDRNVDRPMIDDIVSRVGRLRCAAAIEQVESQMKMLGFSSISPRNLGIDARSVFPANVLRFSFFGHRLWERTWLLAATSSMDGDNWWIIQTQPADSTTTDRTFDTLTHASTAVCSAQVICNMLLPAQQTGYSSLADLGHCLTGFLAIYANARFLEDLQYIKTWPPLEHLKIGPGLQIPDLNIEYEATRLPETLRIALPAGVKMKAFIKKTVRLAFHGVDQHRNVAIMVAYGNMYSSFPALSDLIPEDDRSLVLQKTGTSFALRLVASPGYPVVATLFENLQRLESVLSIYEVLRRKKLNTCSLSLSHLGFVYGPGRDLFAQFDIKTQVQSTTKADALKLVLGTGPLFYLYLGISFGHSNPHRRIQGSLASNLNRPTADAGLDTFTELLSFTLPVMRAFDQLMATTSHTESLKVHVTVRHATSYQIHYPLEGCRFLLGVRQHQNQPVWVLKDVPSSQEGPGELEFKRKLLRSLYDSKGTGWRGLGSGIIAEPDHVGNLLAELDKFMISIRADVTSKPPDSKPPRDSPATNDQPPAIGLAKAAATPDTREGLTIRSSQQRPDPAPQPTDVIMID